MRKFLALAMVAMLSLTIALAAVSCGQQGGGEATPTVETTPPAETSMPADTGGMGGESMEETGQDTTAQMH